MRTYLDLSNLKKAVWIGIPFTLMCAPRILEFTETLPPEKRPALLLIYLAACLLSLLLMAGMVTAWSTAGGMTGYLPDRSRLLKGLAIALVLGVISFPLQAFWMDPIFSNALQKSGHADHLIPLRFPSTVRGCIALILWSASFQVLFFQAAAMAFFTRLFHNIWTSVVIIGLFRILVAAKQFSPYGLETALMTPIFLAGVGGTVGCLLFARYGLPSVVLFNAVINLHLLVGVLLS